MHILTLIHDIPPGASITVDAREVPLLIPSGVPLPLTTGRASVTITLTAVLLETTMASASSSIVVQWPLRLADAHLPAVSGSGERVAVRFRVCNMSTADCVSSLYPTFDGAQVSCALLSHI